MLVGAILGNWLALTFGLNTSLTAAAIGFLALAVSFAAIRSKANRLGTSDAYKPKIIRVLNHQPAN
jgi:positive regulator of sigma E activity